MRALLLLLLASCLLAVASAQTLVLPAFTSNSRISTELDLPDEQQTIFIRERTVTYNYDLSPNPMTLVSVLSASTSIKALIQSNTEFTMYSSASGCSTLGPDPIAYIPLDSAFPGFTGPKRKYYFGLRDLFANNDFSTAVFDSPQNFRGINCNMFKVSNIQKAGSSYDAFIYVPVDPWIWYASAPGAWIAAVHFVGVICPDVAVPCSVSDAGLVPFQQWYNYFFPIQDTADTDTSLDLGLLASCPLFTSCGCPDPVVPTVPYPVFAPTVTAEVLVTNYGLQQSNLTYEGWDFVSPTPMNGLPAENSWVVKSNAGFFDQSIYAVAFTRNLIFELDSTYLCKLTDISDKSVALLNPKPDNLFQLPPAIMDSIYSQILLSSDPIVIHGLIDFYIIANQLTLTYNGQHVVRGIKCHSWFAWFDTPVLQNKVVPTHRYILTMDFAIDEWDFTESSVQLQSTPVRFQLIDLPTALPTFDISILWEDDCYEKATKAGLIANYWIYDIFSITGGFYPVCTDVVYDMCKAIAPPVKPECPTCPCPVCPTYPTYPNYPDVPPPIKPEFECYINVHDQVSGYQKFCKTTYSKIVQSCTITVYQTTTINTVVVIKGNGECNCKGSYEHYKPESPCVAAKLPSYLDPFEPDYKSSSVNRRETLQAQQSDLIFNSTSDPSVEDLTQDIVLMFGRLDLVNASFIDNRTVAGVVTQYWLGYVSTTNLWFGFYFIVTTGNATTNTSYTPFRLEVFQFTTCSQNSANGTGQCSTSGFLSGNGNRNYTIFRTYDFIHVTPPAQALQAQDFNLPCVSPNPSYPGVRSSSYAPTPSYSSYSSSTYSYNSSRTATPTYNTSYSYNTSRTATPTYNTSYSYNTSRTATPTYNTSYSYNTSRTATPTYNTSYSYNTSRTATPTYNTSYSYNTSRTATPTYNSTYSYNTSRTATPTYNTSYSYNTSRTATPTYNTSYSYNTSRTATPTYNTSYSYNTSRTATPTYNATSRYNTSRTATPTHNSTYSYNTSRTATPTYNATSRYNTSRTATPSSSRNISSTVSRSSSVQSSSLSSSRTPVVSSSSSAYSSNTPIPTEPPRSSHFVEEPVLSPTDSVENRRRALRDEEPWKEQAEQHSEGNNPSAVILSVACVALLAVAAGTMFRAVRRRMRHVRFAALRTTLNAVATV
ncbi:hypothetical protein CAOG_04344 [Capsaspora owczarzaki ATCC 30864]|uniref:Uncharacterized protein n=1 Tax=Capsaspora owczarzaki (strain ATCC 30864) TaxID=595528 RepID=A0A0D2VRQ5_CAPO3|nr:hypothetical protein CAOG_04344 [Capsaspora owczarzaki ATCC 30864]KJE93577.1 hypothetical protein CAOG_004344 [Capsaspora owczarzaki ATCC 30864]|eukprot:XP_004348172.1 hypothetical protein CAOG_04344 [Capsaspora owczarzaki ATCC 30864]